MTSREAYDALLYDRIRRMLHVAARHRYSYLVLGAWGCGGVMRVAPIGLFIPAADTGKRAMTDRAGAEIAALTHGHPFGWLPAHIVKPSMKQRRSCASCNAS